MMTVETSSCEAIHDMIEAAHAFYSRGWLPGTSGNFSVRLEGRRELMLISASGKEKGRLSPDDFLICDMEARPVGESLHRPSAETLIHGAIYNRFPEAGAIYHVHEVHAALCSQRDWEQGVTVFAELEMIKALGIWDRDARIEVPIIENFYDIPQLADAIARVLKSEGYDGRVPGVNIRRHGIYAWGATPFEARRHVEAFAYLYEYGWKVAI